MAFFSHVAALAALATAGCSLLVGDGDMSSGYGELPIRDAPGASTPSDGAPDGGLEGASDAPDCDPATCLQKRIFTAGSAVADYPIVAHEGRIYFGHIAHGELQPARISSSRPDGLDVKEHYRGDFRPVRLAFDDLYLHAAVQRDSDQYASVRRIAKQGHCGNDCELDGLKGLAGGVAVTGGEIVWSVGKGVRVVRPGTTTPRRSLPEGASPAKELRSDGAGGVLVLESGIGATGGIRRFRPGATALGPLVTIASPLDFAIGATELFVLALDGSVRAYPKLGGTPRALAAGLTGARHITLDGANLYLTRVPPQGPATIVAVAVNGASEPRVLATTTTEPFAITADASAIYWTDASASVWRLPK